MSFGEEQVLTAARAALLAPAAVTDGFRGTGVSIEGADLVVAFGWKQHPREFQVRVPVTDLQQGPWTGVPTPTPSDWVNDVSGLLMEELDTGATHWALRSERDGRIELDLGAGPPTRSAYHVGTASSACSWWLRERGLDVAAAVAAEAAGSLRAWLQMYVDNDRGEPVVAQAVVVEGPAAASAGVIALQVVAEVPLPDLTRLAHHALCVAAESGAEHLTCSFSHPALLDAGMRPDDTDGLFLSTLDPWPVPAALRATP